VGTAALLAGDIVSFMLFAAIGRGSHGEATGLAALGEVAGTAAPFLLGWLAVAPFAGALDAKLLAQPRRLLRRTLLAWLLAWPLGLLLRALFLQRAIPGSFAIVVGITNSVLLLGWRGVAAWVAKERIHRRDAEDQRYR
jgi:hypothetical protein